WILDALGELSDDLLLTALDDRSVSLRLNALEAVAPRLASGNEKLVAAVLAAAHARQPEVRRMAAVVIGELPDTIALPALVRLAQRAGALPGMADAIVSGLAGRELAWLQAVAATDTGEASSVIAHATGIVIARPTPAEVEGLFQLIDNAPADSLFVSAALDAFERVTTGHRNAMARLQLPVEPTALQHYAARATPQERARIVRVLSRIDGPAQRIAVAPLTAEEQLRFDQGQALYAVGAGCHQANGNGMDGLAPSLVSSRWATGDARTAAAIVLHGKAGDQLAM